MKICNLLLVFSLLFLNACASKQKVTTVEAVSLKAQAAKSHHSIGVAVDASALRTNNRYRELVAGEFNSLTPENAMKLNVLWPEKGVFAPDQADEVLAFAKQHQMTVRAHPLVWHRQNPKWLTELSADELSEFLEKHLSETTVHFATQVALWDVVNEAILQVGLFRRSIWFHHLGPKYIETAFRVAAANSAGALLYYNDFDLAYNRKKLDAVLWLLDSLAEYGLRVDGIGFQMHLRPNAMPTLTQIQAAFELVHSRGYSLQVTELDVALPLPANKESLEQQAQVVHDVVCACIEQTACSSITVWGLTDAHSWVPSVLPGLGAATLFGADYEKKPAYQAAQRAFSRKQC